MSEIELEVRPRQGVILSGESLFVDTVIRNHTQQPFQVPGDMDPSVFVYRLDPEKPDGPQYVLSERQMAVSMSKGTARPPQVMNPMTLPAGGWTTREEEIARYSSEPILSGKYRLSVMQTLPEGIVSSVQVPVEIETPRPSDYSAQTCLVTRTRPGVFAHITAIGGQTLFQRESRVGHPRHSVFHRRQNMEKIPEGFQVSVCVTVKAVPLQGMGRWFAWLGPAGLTAQYAYGTAVPLTAGPAATDLDAPRLLPVGFETLDRVAMVFILGQRQGKSLLQAHRISKDGIERAWEAPFGPEIPHQVFLRHEPSGEAGKITLLWVETSGDKSVVYSLAYTSEGKKLSPEPQRLAQFAEPLAALDLAPVPPLKQAGQPDPPLHILTGPDSQNQMAYRRIWLNSQPEIPPLRFPAPTGSPDAWAISAVGSKLPVMVKVGTQLLVTRAGDTAWQVVASHLSGARHLQVYTLDNKEYYVEWLDPEKGFRLVRVF